MRAFSAILSFDPTAFLITVYTFCIFNGLQWDEAKSEANLNERGFDFDFAASIFDGPTLEKEDRRRDYGERRIIAVGVAEGIAITVVYTDRTSEGGTPVRRIISARRSDRRERRAYEEAS